MASPGAASWTIVALVASALAAGCVGPSMPPEPPRTGAPPAHPGPDAAAEDAADGGADGADAPPPEEGGDEDEERDDAPPPPRPFVESVENCTFSPTGRNPFLVLEPGWMLLLRGREGGETVQQTITVTNGTKTVDGVETRVVVEEELEDGELAEVSWNYLAICTETSTIFYFGEDVDEHDDGNVYHPGAWLAGVNGARAGVLMPGDPKVGMAFHTEYAPKKAMDFAEIVAVNETVTTPAGTFTGAVKVKETSELESGVGYKWFAPGVGVVVDESLKLVSYGPEA